MQITEATIVVPERNARQAERIVCEVEREERHQPHKATKRQPSASTPSTSRSRCGPARPLTQSAATKRPTTNAAVAPSVAPARFRIVPQSGPNSRPPASPKIAPGRKTIVPSAKSTTWPTGAQAPRSRIAPCTSACRVLSLKASQIAAPQWRRRARGAKEAPRLSCGRLATTERVAAVVIAKGLQQHAVEAQLARDRGTARSRSSCPRGRLAGCAR